VTLAIIPASEPIPVDQTAIMIYGEPGAWKTSTAFTSESPLTLDFAGQGGVYRSAFRKDSVMVNTWADVAALSPADLKPFKTIVIDTVGGCLDLMSLDIVKNSDAKLVTSFGGLTLQGYGALKSRFSDWVRQLKNYGLDIVFVAHSKEKESNDRTVYRPDITGSSYDLVFGVVDSVGHLYMSGTDHVLSWDPTGQSVGKNPAQLPTQVVPHFGEEPNFLANKISAVKIALGRMSTEGREIAKVVGEWVGEVKAAETAEAVNALVVKAKALGGGASTQIKAMVAKRATDLKLKWDKKEACYA
jgi:hypothetical protein